MRHRFAHRLPVRFADTDAQGHVFFANYFTFCDEALTDYFRTIGCRWQDVVAGGVDMFYRSATCDFQGRLRFEEQVAIHTRISRFGNSSFDSEFSVYAGDAAETPVALAKLTSVCVDAKAGTAVRVPDLIRDAVSRYEAGD